MHANASPVCQSDGLAAESSDPAIESGGGLICRSKAGRRCGAYSLGQTMKDLTTAPGANDDRIRNDKMSAFAAIRDSRIATIQSVEISVARQ
jgi:hypothetical protein